MSKHSSASIVATFLAAACASAPVAYPDASLEGLFESERAFARASTERGIRASFLEYFATDGIDFRPGPGPMRERMRARPVPADPLALLLDWSPQAGAVARSGDLGFTTGPYVLRNQRDATAPTRYGYFFSVWKRENGVWRVALDAGVSTPAAPAPDSLRLPESESGKAAAPRFLPQMRSDRGKAALLAIERAEHSLDPEPGEMPSYFALLGNSVRVLREGSYALLGPDAVHKALAAAKRRMRWTPVDGGTSASDDFGYTYGSYARLNGAAKEAEGYYVHVWQRDDAGAWRIVLEVLLPPE